MNTGRITTALFLFAAGLLISGCASRRLIDPTITPIPTLPPTPTFTLSPTPTPQPKLTPDADLLQGTYTVTFTTDELAQAGVTAHEWCDNYISHSSPSGLPSGREGVKQYPGMFRTAFPDLSAVIDDMIAEGDRVVTRI